MNAIIESIPKGFVPAYFMYIIAAISILSFLLLTLAYKKKSTNWGNFGWVFLFSVIIIGILTASLALIPEQVSNLITKVKSFFGF